MAEKNIYIEALNKELAKNKPSNFKPVKIPATTDFTGLGTRPSDVVESSTAKTKRSQIGETYDIAMQQELANQDGWEVLGKTFAGFGSQAMYGALLQLAGNVNAGGILDNGEGQYATDFQRGLIEKMNKAQEKYQIYSNPYDGVDNFLRGFARQVQGAGLTAGIMAESVGESIALSLATGGLGTGASVLKAAKTMKNMKNMSSLRNLALGAYSGLKEANMNAAFTEQEVRDRYKSLGGFTDEQIEDIAGKAARRAYKAEALPMIIGNALQMGALGHYNPWKKLPLDYKGASGFVETLGSKMLEAFPQMGKVGSKIAEKGVEAVAEGFEEGYQNFISKKAQYDVDKEYGTNKYKTLSDYIWNQEMTDNIVGGAFGSLFFGPLASISNRVGANKDAERFNKNYDTLLKAGIRKSAEDFETLKKSFEKGTPEQVEKVRRAVNMHQTLWNLRYDSAKGSGNTSLFDDRIHQMSIIFDAATSNDTETLKKFGISDKEDIEYIKQSYPTLIEDSISLKNDLSDNVAKSIDYDAAERLTELSFARKHNAEELQRVKSNILLASSSSDINNILSPKLSAFVKINAELKGLQSTNDTPEKRTRIELLQNQLEGLKDENFNPDALTEEQLNTISSIKDVEHLENLYKASYTLEDVISENNKVISEFSTPEKQLNNKKERFQEALKDINSINSVEGLTYISKEAEKFGLLDEALKNQIDSKKLDIVAKENAKATSTEEVKDEEIPPIVTKDVVESRKKNADSVASTKTSTDLDADIQNTFNDLFQDFEEQVPKRQDNPPIITEDLLGGFVADFKPVFADNNDMKDKFKGTIKKALDKNPDMSFEEFYASIYKYNPELADRAFNYLVEGWRDNGKVIENPEDIYKEYFASPEILELEEIFFNSVEKKDKKEIEKTNKVTTVEDAKKSIKEAEELVDKVENPVYEDVNDSEHIAEANPKIPFLGLIYKVTYEGVKGVYYFEDNDVDLNRNGDSNLDIILNHRVFNEGTKFEIRISQNWADRKVSQWFIDKTGEITSKSVTMRDWLIAKGFTEEEIATESFKNDKTKYDLWLSKVPMSMFFEGKDIGYGVHDTEWWNERNTANFRRKYPKEEAEIMQKELIAKGKKEAMRIRRGVAKGNTQMVITERRRGFAAFVDEKLPRLTLNKTNPSAILCFMNDKGEVLVKMPDSKSVKVLDPSSILNADGLDNMDEGHAYMLTEADYKDGKPLYILNKIVTNDVSFQAKGNDAFRKISESLQVVEVMRKILTGETKNPTDSEIEKAKKLKKDIMDLTDLNIADDKDIKKLRGLFPRQVMKDGKYVTTQDKEGREVKMYNLSIQKGGFTRNTLPVIYTATNGDIIVKNYKSPVSEQEGYEAFLKDHLTTQRRFFKINTEDGKTMHIAYPQPILDYNFQNPEKVEPIKEEEEDENDFTRDDEFFERGESTEEEGEEIVDEVAPETEEDNREEIENILPGQKQRIVKHFLHNILKSLGEKDITYSDVVKELNNAFSRYSEELKNNPKYQREYEYLMKHKDELLGIGAYSKKFNTIREQLEVWIGEKIDEDAFDDNMSLETESETLKQYDASSFEYDMKNGLSSRLKRLFCGIPKTRQTLQKFGNIPEYYEADAIYDTLQYILADTPNSMEDFEKKLLAKYESNKKAFEFLPEVLKRLKDTDIQFQKELLFRLNQTKNEMFMILVEDKDNGISVQAINANSKEPVLRLQNAFKEDFKNSDLVIREGEGYKVDKNTASKVIKTFEDWVKNNEDTKFKNVPVEDVKRWLDIFGIFVSEKTLQDIKNNNINSNIYEGRTWSSLFGKSGLLYKLSENTKKLSEKSEKLSAKSEVLSFNKDSENIVRYGIGGFLKDLAIVEVNNTVNNCSVMRIAGKNVMFFSQPNYVSEQLRKIKTNEAVLKNLSTAAFSKNSMLLSILNQKDEDGKPTDLSKKFKKIFNVSYASLQALKIKGNKNSDKAGITDLASKDYEVLLQAFMEAKGVDLGVEPISKINLVSSKMCFPPLSDSSQAFVLDTVKLALTKANFDFGKDGELELDNNLLELLYSQLVLPDLERMNAYREAIKNGEDINIEFQGIGSELFTSIAALNTLKITGEKGETELLRHVKNGGKITEEIKSDIKKFLQSFIEHEAKAKKETWIKEGIIKEEDGKLTVLLDESYLNSKYPEGSLNSKTTIAALDFVINHYLNQAQIQMLFSGDFCNYTESLGKFGKAMGFKVGDLKGETDAEKFFYYMDSLSSEDREKAYVEYLRVSSVNYFKRLKAQLSPGNRLAESKNKKYYQIIVNDEESVSSVVDYMIKLWYPDSYKKNEKNLEELNKIIKELEDENVENRLELETKYTAIVSILKKDYPVIKDYFEIKYTDGQEFTTWKEHLDILLNQGKISEALYETANKKLTSQSKDGVNDENRLSEDEKKVIFQPIKPLHAGLYFENKGDYKLQRYVYIKTSSFPLLPEMTQGIKLDKVRKNIEAFEKSKGEEGRVRVTYRSGIKVGSTNKNISMNDLYSDDYEAIKDSIESSSLVLDRENFSIQQDKPFKTDKHVLQAVEDSINMGTQIDKIIFGNGINTIEDKIFPNLFDEDFLDEFEISKDEKLSGKELYDFYNKINIKEQEILRRNLLEKLGIADNTEWYNSEETLRKIEELLSDRLSNYQDAGIIGLRYKVLNEEGEYYYASESEVKEKKLKYESVEFNIPPWISPNSQKFESVLNSIVNNNIIKLKMTGGSSPVASSEGFQIRDYDNLTEEEKSGIILTESFKGKLKASEIVENGTKVRYAQVLLPCKLRTTYTDTDGKKITKLIDPRDYTKVVDGKTVLDFDRIDPEVLKFFSFRIPTSSHQSGTLIEVVGFLPHSMADTMIVPKDHVTQIGEDFDIDVRYFYKYSTITDETGKIRRLKMSDIPLESAEKRSQDIYEEYRETKKSIKAERNQLISDLWKNNKAVATRLEEAKLELTMILIDKDTNQLLDNLLGTDYKEDIKYLEKEIESLESIILEDSTIKEKQKEAKKELDSYLETLKNSLTEEQKEVFKTYRNEKALRSLKQKVLENNKVAIYQSIYSAPNEDVQKRINAVLSTDFANKTANLIEKKRNSLVDSSFFSIYSDAVQKDSLKSGASGKLGIAIHSNWVVFNSLMEQLPEELKVQLKEKMGEGFDDFSLVLGKNESTGILGSGKTFDGHRSIATVNMENQNCSTDNQKLGIMGKRNENPYTINEFALLCNLGFDQDNGLHIPSLFISQPIMLRYVELKQSYDSQFSERISEIEKGRLIDEALLKEFCPELEVDEYGFFDNFDEVSKTMDANTLVENLTIPNQEVQWATYLKFKKLQKASKNLTKVMQLLNIEKDGLGISFFDTIDKKNDLLNMFKDVENVENGNVNETLSMKNVHNLFGVYLKCENISVEEEKKLLDKGFYFVEKDDKNISYYLKPTTAQNAKIINSLSLGYNLWKNIFPFEDKIISEQINKIFEIANVDPNSRRGKDMKYAIASSMKDYIYSYRNKNLFEDSVENERKKLFIDSATNISLARKLSILKGKNIPLFELPFFKNLEFNVFKDGTKPSTIQYNVGSNSGINKNEAYTSLEGLLNSNAIVDESLGDYTEDDLLKDLIKYTLLADQEEGAVGFRNYLPIEALEKYKITNMLRVLTSAQNNKFGLLFNERFTEQFFQHNYKEARTLSWSAKIKDFTFGDSPSWSKSTFINLKDDVKRHDFYCIKNPGKKEYALYKHVGEGRYERIPILGGFGVNEYSVLNDVKESLYKSNNVPKSSGKVIIDNKRVGKSLTEGVSSTNVIAYIAKNSKNKGLREIASTLQKYAGEGVKVFSNPDLIEGAGIEGLYTTSSNETFEKGNIYIDSSISKDIDTEKFQTVFIEEYVHSITSSTLKEWIEGSEIKLVNGEIVTDIKLKDGAPYYAIKMVSVYKQGVNALIDNYTKDGKMTLEEAFEKINILQKAMKKDKDSKVIFQGYNAIEQENLYRVYNIEEFIAGFFVSPEFRKIMDKAEYKDTEFSLLEQFKDIIKKIFKSLNITPEKDSVTEHAIDALFSMLDKVESNLTVINPHPDFDKEKIRQLEELLTEDNVIKARFKEENKVTLSEKDNLQRIATLNKGTRVSVKYEKYDKSFNAVITGELSQVASPTEAIHKDGTVEYLDEGSYAIQIKTNTGKLLTANLYEITGLKKETLNLPEEKPISKEEADFFGDIDPNSGVDFKPKFEKLFTEGKIKTQGFYLTLEEFNSMTEEEQINFLNCL